VLVSARRLSQLGLVDAALERPALVEETTRALSAPELVAEVADSADPAGPPGGPGSSRAPAQLTGVQPSGAGGNG
jgi:hypothetical protein